MSMKILTLYIALTILFAVTAAPAYPSDKEVLKPRVPVDKLAEARALKNTVMVNTAETLAEAREIFMGKGVCASCHGENGRGDGPAGRSFNPPPRNFLDAEWQKVRTDGEIFWAITNGTSYGMLAFEDMLSAEERWMLVSYIRELGSSVGVAKKD